MSAHHLSVVARLRLPDGPKLVLLCLADDAGAQTGIAVPGLEEIMAWAGRGKSAVMDAITVLVERGLVERVSGGHRGARAEFRVLCPCPEHNGSAQADPIEGNGAGKGPDRVRELPDPLNPSTLKTKNIPTAAAAAFDAFWAAYPRKVGKDAARTAFARAVKRSSVQDVTDGLARYRFPPDQQYIPYPATWLNQGRWQDEQPAPPKAAAHKPWEIYA